VEPGEEQALFPVLDLDEEGKLELSAPVETSERREKFSLLQHWAVGHLEQQKNLEKEKTKASSGYWKRKRNIFKLTK
jgi:hypothetical protein